MISDALFVQALQSDNPRIILSENSGSTISSTSLSLIRGSGKIVELELANGLVLSIDSSKISSNARSIDLNIDIVLTNRNTPVDGVPDNSIVLFPATHGTFGFEISFTFTAVRLSGAGLSANTARFFYVDANGRVTEHSGIVRNVDGSVTLTIDRASFYVLSAEAPNGRTPSVPPPELPPANNNNNNQPPTNNQQRPPSNQNNQNPATNVVIGAVPTVISGAVVIASKKKRKQSN
jgi:hypothetical protein